MEFIPITINVVSNAHNPDGSHTKITFKKDCTESRYYDRNVNNCNNLFQNMQTYNHPDPTKDGNLIFPQMFTDFIQVMCSSHSGNTLFQNRVHLKDNGLAFLQYVFKKMVIPFKNLEKENKHLREQLESKDQELSQMKEQLQTKDQELKEKDHELEEMKEQLKELQEILKTKDQELKTSLLTASTLNEATLHHDRTLFSLKYVIEVNCEKLQEKDQKLKNIQEELGNIQEELDTTYQELKELQEDFETKDQELKDAKEEVKTRGLLLKSCVEELKTYVEEVEEVEKKNQELEHLNHRLIYETSSFVERNSYFSPEM